MHYWDATPANWVPGAEQYAKGWIECFHAYQSLGPKETHWPIEKFEGYTEDDLMKDVFEDGHVDIAIFQPTYLKEWYTRGVQHHRAERRPGGEAPGQVHRQHPVRPPRRRRGHGRVAPQRRAVRVQGREAVHGRVEQRLARLQAERPGRLPLPRGSAETRDQERARAQGPDDLAAGQGRVRRLRRRPRGDRLPGAELHRRARGAAADRGLLLHGDAGAQRLRGPVGGDRRADARAARSSSPR